MLKPVSEKKLLCVKCGLRTRSCTQSRTPRTSSLLMATQSRLMVKSSHCVEYPRITSVVNWNTWKTQLHEKMKQFTRAGATSLFGYDTYFIQVPTNRENQPVQNRTTGRHLRQGGSSWTTAPAAAVLAQRTGTYSARHSSTSLPLVQPFSSNPSKSLLKSCEGATSSPPTTIAGQKQLKPCPLTERAATVDRKQFKKSSRNRRASRRISFCR